MSRRGGYHEISWLSPTHREKQQKLENVDSVRANAVPGNKSYAEIAVSRKTKNGITKNVIVFGDSILRGIRARDFNQQVKNGCAKFDSFPGCNSKENVTLYLANIRNRFL